MRLVRIVREWNSLHSEIGNLDELTFFRFQMRERVLQFCFMRKIERSFVFALLNLIMNLLVLPGFLPLCYSYFSLFFF